VPRHSSRNDPTPHFVGAHVLRNTWCGPLMRYILALHMGALLHRALDCDLVVQCLIQIAQGRATCYVAIEMEGH